MIDNRYGERLAHHFEHFEIKKGNIGLEYTFLTQSMMGMVTHPHAKPKEIAGFSPAGEYELCSARPCHPRSIQTKPEKHRKLITIIITK